MLFSKAFRTKLSQAGRFTTPDDYLDDTGGLTVIVKNNTLYKGPAKFEHGDLAKKYNLNYGAGDDFSGRISSDKSVVALWDVFGNSDPYNDVIAEGLQKLYNAGLITLNTKVFIHPQIQGLPLVNYLRNLYKKQEEQPSSFSVYN